MDGQNPSLYASSSCVHLRLLAGPFDQGFRLLSPGQTDWQVDASGRKLNLHRDLRWVAKRTPKFPRKYAQVAKKKHFKVDCSLFHWLICRLMIGKWASLNLR